MTSSRVTREGVDGLLDHSAAQARALDELRSVVWWGTEIILEVRDLVRRYDLDRPGEEQLFLAIEHYVHTCPVIDPDLHRLPLPLRMPPGTPGDGACGEAAPSLGPGVDIVRVKCRGCGAIQTHRVCDACFGFDTSHAFDDLRVTEEEDGRS